MTSLQPVAGRHYPRSLGELRSWFATDADCLDYLEWLRWPDGFVCAACGHRVGWPMAEGRLCCARCDRRTSVTAGTIFDRNTHAADGVVHRLLAVGHPEGRGIGSWVRLLYD